MVILPTKLRQMHFKGNLVSTIYGSNSEIKSLAYLGGNLFQTGNQTG